MNVISIDSSTSCTAMIVNGKIFVYANSKISMGKTGMRKNFKACSEIATIRPIEAPIDKEDATKLEYYQRMATAIYNDIKNTIDESTPSFAFMEGYSFSSNAGMIIDLASIGTLIRFAMLKLNIKYEIISPKSLKLDTCKMVYGETIIMEGVKKNIPKVYYRNRLGTSGGSFDKVDMCRAIQESKWKDDWAKFIRDNIKLTDKMTKIITPHEDVNDAYLLYKTGKDALRRN